MMQKLEFQNFRDEDGNPRGGYVNGVGITLEWQNGPLGRHSDACLVNPVNPNECNKADGCTRLEPNGAFVEGVIMAALQRIEFYQDSKFRCIENEMAADHLRSALNWLNYRTNNREAKKVEGTHSV